MSLIIPAKVPKKGFYYHYKHDPAKGVNDHAYRMVNVACHTEDNCRPEDRHLVIYRPIYPQSVYEAGKLDDARPLEMWMGDVTKDGKTFPRFQKITDPAIIAKLKEIEREMYPPEEDVD